MKRAGFTPKTMHNAKGYVRAFDARTGKRLWIFHTIPKPGEYGYDTWEDGSALRNGNNGKVATGAGFLLAHSHAIVNVKEALLVEYTQFMFLSYLFRPEPVGVRQERIEGGSRAAR